MIPWPVTIFVVLYTVLGTAMAAQLWRVMSARAWPHLALPLFWCAVFMTLAVGLSFLRPWARKMAVWLSVFLMVATLGSALVAILHTPPQPKAAVWGTLLAALQCLAMRYLTRPHVKAWFVKTVSSE